MDETPPKYRVLAPPEPRPPERQPWLVSPANLDSLSWCPDARLLYARSPNTACGYYIITNCKRWTCRYCAAQKIKQLARKVCDAKPNRMLTLTTSHSLYSTPRDCFERTVDKVPTLITYLRARFGEVEYFRVTEVCADGYPHYHFLVRSGFLPFTVVRDRWKSLTGAVFINLKPIRDTFRSYSYVSKYLSKLHRITFTERHCSYTRDFFPPSPEFASQSLDLQAHEYIHGTPRYWLEEFALGKKIVWHSSTIYQVLDDDAVPIAELPPHMNQLVQAQLFDKESPRPNNYAAGL